MGDQTRSIIWFRNDFRIKDNPALYHAINNDSQDKIIPIFIYDDHLQNKQYQRGSASKLWMHYALMDLQQSLNNNLLLFKGDAKKHIGKLIEKYNIKNIYFNICFEPHLWPRDKEIKDFLEDKGVRCHIYNGSLLWNPKHIVKKDNKPYKVFTPFYRKGCLLNLGAPRALYEEIKIDNINFKRFTKAEIDEIDNIELSDLDLLPKINWDKKILDHWDISENGANKTLNKFIKTGLLGYKEGRNFPSQKYISRLSPYLHFGQISPNYVWYKIKEYSNKHKDNNDLQQDIDHFYSEMGWREFSYNLLYHNHDLASVNLQSKFDKFPWNNDERLFKLWTKGQTGYPIIDAGMRELWKTGYIHNRVRMVVASFLVKNLLIDWRKGEKWFFDCLVDADYANNAASWQWVAGCGSDSVPYFRIFNPITQGQKFDPEGEYSKKWLPELKHVPAKKLFNLWELDDALLKKYKVELGVTYPKPIIDIKSSREKSISIFHSL